MLKLMGDTELTKNIMDKSSLHQLMAVPIKNLLEVQRIKDGHYCFPYFTTEHILNSLWSYVKVELTLYFIPSGPMLSLILHWDFLTITTCFDDSRIKWMNSRACTNEAYIPTSIEHVANVATHGIWVVPSVIGGLELIRRSITWTQLVSAYVYGTSLILVFAVSTFFHSVHYYNHNRQLKDALHRCDRAMIYIFIAASYFPWLNVDHFPDDELLFAMRYLVWIMAIVGIIYQQIFHEKYKMLETIFYLVIGIGPSVAIINVYNYYNITELKMGGLIYIFGLVFFKSDGRIPCAHAIWHLFVAAAAACHYYAILSHVFPATGSPDIFIQAGVPSLPKLLKSHIEEL